MKPKKTNQTNHFHLKEKKRSEIFKQLYFSNNLAPEAEKQLFPRNKKQEIKEKFLFNFQKLSQKIPSDNHEE
jgi:hypothetical protein